jgi:predicted DNA-binding protein
MRNTISVRLPDDLAQWLETTAVKTGVSQGSIIRKQLERARELQDRPFLALAGKISGPKELSSRKGFSKS